MPALDARVFTGVPSSRTQPSRVRSTVRFGGRGSARVRRPPRVPEDTANGGRHGEIALDLEEGADAARVKPALAYLDVIGEARRRFDAPIAAYNVSGEYAMVKAAAANGWIDEKRIVGEILTGIVRAGADFVLTYHARDAARWIAEGSLPH